MSLAARAALLETHVSASYSELSPLRFYQRGKSRCFAWSSSRPWSLESLKWYNSISSSKWKRICFLVLQKVKTYCRVFRSEKDFCVFFSSVRIKGFVHVGSRVINGNIQSGPIDSNDFRCDGAWHSFSFLMWLWGFDFLWKPESRVDMRWFYIVFGRNIGIDILKGRFTYKLFMSLFTHSHVTPTWTQKRRMNMWEKKHKMNGHKNVCELLIKPYDTSAWVTVHLKVLFVKFWRICWQKCNMIYILH